MEIKDLATSVELGSEMADVHGGRGYGYGKRKLYKKVMPWYPRPILNDNDITQSNEATFNVDTTNDIVFKGNFKGATFDGTVFGSVTTSEQSNSA